MPILLEHFSLFLSDMNLIRPFDTYQKALHAWWSRKRKTMFWYCGGHIQHSPIQQSMHTIGALYYTPMCTNL